MGMKPTSVKMLIVDDDLLIGAMLRDFFKQAGHHFEFFLAIDGEEAMKLCLEVHPDIIITDVMLPKMTGIELITQLRKLPEFAVTPIVAITAGNQAMQDAVHKAGAHMVLEKPIRRIDIIHRVDALLDATPFIPRL